VLTIFVFEQLVLLGMVIATSGTFIVEALGEGYTSVNLWFLKEFTALFLF
jgi:hypothetical protein